MAWDPYELRAKGLDQALKPFELGRALYHLGQRRGFKSNRKSGKAVDDKGMLADIGQLARDIEGEGARTLGEHLFHLSQDDKHRHNPLELGLVRLRKRHTRRDMYEDEFAQIITAQTPHHGTTLNEDFVAELNRVLFFQHSFELTEERRRKAPAGANLHRAPSVKNCPLVPDERCCPRGEWIAQQFRLLKELNNLKISENYGIERALTQRERDAVLMALATADKKTFAQLRVILAKLGTDPHAVFNLEWGERNNLKGNILDWKLSTALGKRAWQQAKTDLKKQLRDALLHEEDPEDLVRILLDAGVTENRAERLKSWLPPDGYVAFSKSALELIVPFLEQGFNEYEAIMQAFPERIQSETFDKLPALSDKSLPPELRDISNPIVRRTLVELRKVVNALVREHGKPSRIVVELAREMKSGPDARRRFSRMRAEREKMRVEAREAVESLGGNPNSRQDINRWMFWKEQGGICPYSNKPIPQSELIHGGEWEVDHILPHWQSLDDSQMNKVLVHRLANAEKGDRTPAQWLGMESEVFRQLIQRVEGMAKSTGLPYPKLLRIKQEKVDTDAFSLRQLNDTRYASRAAVQYLNLLFPELLRSGERAVMSCRGGLTAELRRQWGLNNVLDDLVDAEGKPVQSEDRDSEGTPRKSRADHRHHAIDAVVIALSSRKNLKRYQDYWKADGVGEPGPRFLDPWPGFRSDVIANAARINVSHRPLRKIDGALHKDTFYGQAKAANSDPIPGRYVTRKPLKDLTGKSVAQIRDPFVRSLIEAKLRGAGWDGKTNSLPKGWAQNRICLPSSAISHGIPIRKVRIEEPLSNVIHLGHRHANSGSNHHVAFYVELDPANDSNELKVRLVSRMEAARRARRERTPIIKRDYGENCRFLMSLSRKESLLIQSPDRRWSTLCIVQSISGSSEGKKLDIMLRDARDSRLATSAQKKPYLRIRSIKRWAGLVFEKVSVDPLGRVFPAND